MPKQIIADRQTEKINIAIVGVGYWGPNLVRNFFQVNDVNVCLVCDRDPKRLELIKKNYPTIQTTQQFKDVLKNPEIQAVAIALPTKYHYQAVKQCLLAGKHVWVEKPMTSNSREAEELVKIAKEKERILMVDHTFIYSGAIQKIKELIDKDELGKIHYFDSQRLNLGLLRPDTNVVGDLAIHDISIIDYLFSQKPKHVLAIGSSHILNRREEMAHINLQHEEGLVSHIHVSWLSPVKLRQILVGGNKKMVFFDDVEPTEKIKIYDKGVDINMNQVTPFTPLYREGDVLVPKLDQTETLKKACGHFSECIKSGRTPLTSGESGLRSLRIMEAIQKSIKSGGKLIRNI